MAMTWISSKRGYLMGIRETPRGTFTAVQGQHWYEFDMMGQILADRKLPRGFLDASHESIKQSTTPCCFAWANAIIAKKMASIVPTIRDQLK
jgi:arylsulfate sulfotransferase